MFGLDFLMLGFAGPPTSVVAPDRKSFHRAAVWAIIGARFSLLCAIFAAKSQSRKRLSYVKNLLNTKICTNLSQNAQGISC